MSTLVSSSSLSLSICISACLLEPFNLLSTCDQHSACVFLSYKMGVADAALFTVFRVHRKMYTLYAPEPDFFFSFACSFVKHDLKLFIFFFTTSTLKSYFSTIGFKQSPLGIPQRRVLVIIFNEPQSFLCRLRSQHVFTLKRMEC